MKYIVKNIEISDSNKLFTRISRLIVPVEMHGIKFTHGLLVENGGLSKIHPIKLHTLPNCSGEIVSIDIIEKL